MLLFSVSIFGLFLLLLLLFFFFFFLSFMDSLECIALLYLFLPDVIVCFPEYLLCVSWEFVSLVVSANIA